MAKSVEAGFQQFHQCLTPLPGESKRATSHRASIGACLKSRFSVTRFFQTGSFGNATSIRGYSDVDYFAIIPARFQVPNSADMLITVRNVLADRFPGTGVKIDSPAVTVPFGTTVSENTEVVPAYFDSRDRKGRDIYKIANGEGGWLKSNPEKHKAYVKGINDKMGRKVKHLVRFLKAWKYYHKVPISSFYLELRVTQYARERESIIYGRDVRRIFQNLFDCELAALRDPEGISGYIQSCSTQQQKAKALAKLKSAAERARKAKAAEDAGNIEKAFYWWNIVFNGHFPTC